MGQQIAPEDLKIGGAKIHHTHWIAFLGNPHHRIVFCTRCGGTTSGAHSPLLADACRLKLAATRQRQVHRMLSQHRWPTKALEGALGRPSLSSTISFVPTEGLLRISPVGTNWTSAAFTVEHDKEKRKGEEDQGSKPGVD